MYTSVQFRGHSLSSLILQPELEPDGFVRRARAGLRQDRGAGDRLTQKKDFHRDNARTSYHVAIPPFLEHSWFRAKPTANPIQVHLSFRIA